MGRKQSQQLAFHSFLDGEQEPGTPGEVIGLCVNLSQPGIELSQVSGTQDCIADPWTQGHCLAPAALPSLSVIPLAWGLGPVIASSSSGVSEGSPGGTVGLPNCRKLLGVHRSGIHHLQVDRCWVTGTQQAPAEQSRECRWQSGLLAGDSAAAWRYEAGGPSRAALEQDKVTLACHPASNTGAVRSPYRAWVTGTETQPARARPMACHALPDRGASPQTPSRHPLEEARRVSGASGSVLSAGLSSYRSRACGIRAQAHPGRVPSQPSPLVRFLCARRPCFLILSWLRLTWQHWLRCI